MNKDKIVYIESQIVETKQQAIDQYNLLLQAKRDGCEKVHDMWGHNAYDEYTIDEALDRFKVPTNISTTYSNGLICEYNPNTGKMESTN